MSDRAGMPASYDEDISREPENTTQVENHYRLREAVLRHRAAYGGIPSTEMEALIRGLAALVDEMVDNASADGEDGD